MIKLRDVKAFHLSTSDAEPSKPVRLSRESPIAASKFNLNYDNCCRSLSFFRSCTLMRPLSFHNRNVIVVGSGSSRSVGAYNYITDFVKDSIYITTVFGDTISSA